MKQYHFQNYTTDQRKEFNLFDILKISILSAHQLIEPARSFGANVKLTRSGAGFRAPETVLGQSPALTESGEAIGSLIIFVFLFGVNR